jgi:molecular chaperone DnaJ
MRREWGGDGIARPLLPAACPACYGAGRAAARACGRCRGEGRARMLRTVRVRVPAGVGDGQILRVKGQGDAGRRGGAAGDLFVKLQVHDLGRAGIERVGDDLHSILPLGLYDALLGVEVAVATVRGQRTISVPAGEAGGVATLSAQ